MDAHELCDNCSMRKGTHKWSGDMGAMAFRVFDSLPMWCELCVVRAHLDYAEKLAARIPELKTRIAELKKM